ncbi:helix-turn-helix domain-containing protein [uncultured Clostridium sp.]|uniref:helix-turn-helix domain-containing protein n=1 Tax=uncultured Clostridium sp. TaxID=59620 RepID=UPI0025DC9CC7|nr:helix-turn-helix transcriptional regulator [uncultured Clostridium sp.]
MIEDTFIKNDSDVQIGSNLKKLRTAKGMRPSELVREVNLLGVSMTIFSLSKIEANTQHVKASQLRAIKEILGCSYEALLE